MSGAELFLGALGAAIPTLQATVNHIGGKKKIQRGRATARDIIDFHNRSGQPLFSAIYENIQDYEDILQDYKDTVEPNVAEKDHRFAFNIRNYMHEIVKKNQDTVRELDRASADPDSEWDHLEALKHQLDRCAIQIASLQLVMVNRLHIQAIPRPNEDERKSIDRPSRKQSGPPSASAMEDIMPLQMSYKGDTQLESPISEGDIATLKRIFARQNDDVAPTFRQTLALLLACRKRLPKVVEFCLEYCADPTVTGEEDGLGAIHNAIGTADVMEETRETIEVLELLIDHGVQPSAPDSTKEHLRPLHYAVKTRNLSATTFLLEKDQEMVNLPDAEGKTALYYACLQPNQVIKLVEQLVAKGANFGDRQRPSMPDVEGQIIIEFLDEQHVD